MSSRERELGRLELTGLELAPAQVFGALRLVPLLRRAAPGDLRLAGVVAGDASSPPVQGCLAASAAAAAYLPHALIVSDGGGRDAQASFGARLGAAGGRHALEPRAVRLARRVGPARRGKRGLRFVPQHLSIEGTLALHFRGPEIAWSEYSRQALRTGVGPLPADGRRQNLLGLEEALRVFEIAADQTGLLLFVANSLATALVVPSPRDYRGFHRSLLVDACGEQLYQYGKLYFDMPPLELSVRAEAVRTLADLRAELELLRARWAAVHTELAKGLLGRTVASETITRRSRFRLLRFLTPLDPRVDNHVGEAILRDDGTVEYLRTDRLTAAQCRRGLLLQRLAEHQWHLERSAAAYDLTKDELLRPLSRAGLGYLLKAGVLRAAQRQRDPTAARDESTTRSP